ncbi:MAG: glycosyltransferase [Eubacteriaceae bacterium]|uniref:Glycosyltransferase family 4 protein n=1 Tax=Candidatus Pseudoramibacter fermentans TaxID=2594427 RepID=A0A6L5GPE9_9FIRM|nr:glycosyltransferase family 4 protein [Candidatus Pseudoramibacter fermentans]RRF92430.1 MAG: glycosyltransferase [Eubacteriaceae bacterium]
MIKIAFVINYITNNGPSNVVLDIIRNLNKEIFDVSLITLFEENDKNIIDDLKSHEVKIFSCKTLSRLKCLLGQDKTFQNIIQKEQFDIIHSHGLIPDFLSSRVRIPTRKVATLHNNMFEDYCQTYGKIKAKILTKIHLKALKKMDCCVCCSSSVFQVMKKYLSNVTYIRNGIKSKIANHTVTRKELNIPDDAIVFIFSGVINYRKNVVYLIAQFVKYHKRNEYLIILGDGPDMETCKCEDSNVIFVGFQDDPVAFYNICNIYTSASRAEGFSISVLEALSCGLGLFLSDIPSHREVVTVGKKFYLGEIFSILDEGQDFNKKLKRLRANYQLFNKIGIQEFQKEQLSDITMTNKYQELYKKIV